MNKRYEMKTEKPKETTKETTCEILKLGGVKKPEQIASIINAVYISEIEKSKYETISPLELGKEVLMTIIGVFIALSITAFNLIYLVILVILFGFRGILIKYGW